MVQWLSVLSFQKWTRRNHPLKRADECVYGGKGYGCWKHSIDGQSDMWKWYECVLLYLGIWVPASSFGLIIALSSENMMKVILECGSWLDCTAIYWGLIIKVISTLSDQWISFHKAFPLYPKSVQQNTKFCRNYNLSNHQGNLPVSWDTWTLGEMMFFWGKKLIMFFLRSEEDDMVSGKLSTDVSVCVCVGCRREEYHTPQYYFFWFYRN